MKEQELLGQKLLEYYSGVEVEGPPEIGKREFGFGEFGKKISARHFGFSSPAEFNSFLRSKTPFYASYSPALYEKPDATPMHAKNFLGAELVYEFDSTDLKTDCSAGHTVWKCTKCEKSGKGNVHYCTSCGEQTTITEFVCPECMDAVKKQTLKLVDVLQGEFGFEGISINYSGSRGFHVHVRSKKIRGIPNSGRIELLDYVTLHNVDLERAGFLFGKKQCSCPSAEMAKGVAKKLLHGAEGFLHNCSAMELHARAPLSKPESEKALKDRGHLVQEMRAGRLLAVGKKPGEFWKQLLESFVEEFSLKIDRQTSVDISKIIRVPETIHGQTMLLAKQVGLDALKAFDALSETIVFSNNPTKLFVEKSPRFFLGGEWFNALESEQAELPEYAALYLLAKEAAKLV